MQIKNNEQRYGLISKLLHWAMALLILFLLALGYYMVELDYYHPWYHDSLELHKALGMLVLFLAFIRLGWLLYNRAPPLVATLPKPIKWAAHTMHGLLWLMMLAIPVSGYLISTSAGDPINLFGLFAVPALVEVNTMLRDLAINWHYYLAYTTLALVTLHAAAALKHHFIDKDDTLKKML